MYANKYSCIFSCQLEAIIHLYLVKDALISRKCSPHNRKHHKKSLYLYLPGSTVSLLATPTTCFAQNNRLGHYPLSRITQSNYFRRKEAKARRGARKINACTHTIVQAVPESNYERGYPIGYFTSRDPRMFFKDVTRSNTIAYLQFDHVQ